MDLTTLFGLIIGLGLIVFAIFAKEGAAQYFWDYPSLLLVLGGTLAATFVNYPFKSVWRVFKVLKNVFKANQLTYEEIMEKFVDLADKVRKNSIMSLEEELPHIKDTFMRNGLELAINERDPDRLRNYLNLELSNMKKRHQLGQEIFFYMGTYSPAFGMVGTIIGLIVMLKNFTMTGINSGGIESLIGSMDFNIATQFKELLGGMGMALLTTFYGLILANLIFIPIGGKLKRRSEEELMLKEVMVEGILCLHNREHPLIVREKLMTFIPTRERKENFYK
ncbi:MAG TPA: motility protein A [Candidatus Marinimicrobia bacterium]|nr:motility protein A [Candidatus Neomarinimicrobiota bacterium]